METSPLRHLQEVTVTAGSRQSSVVTKECIYDRERGPYVTGLFLPILKESHAVEVMGF